MTTDYPDLDADVTFEYAAAEPHTHKHAHAYADRYADSNTLTAQRGD